MRDSQCWTLSCQDMGTSTSDLAKAAALEGAPSGSAFLLGEQTAGRGRQGRHWSSRRGGMYVSVLLYPSRSVSNWFALSFATALAIGFQEGGEPFLNAMLASLSDIDDPTYEQAVAYAIGQNRDPELLPIILDLTMSGKLGTRETYTIMAGQMRQKPTQAAAWRWLQSNYPEFVTRIPGQRPRSTPRLASDLCSPAAIDELEALFETHGDLAFSLSLSKTLSLNSASSFALSSL